MNSNNLLMTLNIKISDQQMNRSYNAYIKRFPVLTKKEGYDDQLPCDWQHYQAVLEIVQASKHAW